MLCYTFQLTIYLYLAKQHCELTNDTSDTIDIGNTQWHTRETVDIQDIYNGDRTRKETLDTRDTGDK